jgi:ferredoxin-type protein NapF
LPEAAFIENCTRCNRCIDACPTHLLSQGADAYPEADFTPGNTTEGCTFCGECVRTCQPAALWQQPGQRPWQLQIEFTGECLAERNVVCHICHESCELEAIHFPLALGGVSRPVLDAAACTGCGACLNDCPTQAIRILRSTANSQLFRGLA